MKKLFKISCYMLATVLILLISQFSAFAANDSSNKDSSLSGIQVIGGLALLLFIILLPLVKKPARKEVI